MRSLYHDDSARHRIGSHDSMNASLRQRRYNHAFIIPYLFKKVAIALAIFRYAPLFAFDMAPCKRTRLN